jgi:two-component system, NarL family, nitrate/nitrite response regulator NarL
MKKQIMIVDDVAICNLMVKKLFSLISTEYEVKDYLKPMDAFQAISSYNPDLIFLDLNMPVLDGWQFLEKMKAENLTNPVIILTSSISNLDRNKCIEYTNVLDYQIKPPSKERLEGLLKTYLSN